MCEDMKSEMYLAHDAKEDILKKLGWHTDQHRANPEAIYFLAKAYKEMVEAECILYRHTEDKAKKTA